MPRQGELHKVGRAKLGKKGPCPDGASSAKRLGRNRVKEEAHVRKIKRGEFGNSTNKFRKT